MIATFVWTDGLGTYQARCTHCDWHGPWRRQETKAVADAEAHGEEHAAS